MLVLAGLWVVLAALCAGAGLALMGPAAKLFVRAGDRLLFASFLGLAVIGALLLAWSLFAPVSSLALVLCAALALVGVAAQPTARASIRRLLADCSPGAAGISLVLVLLLAERSTAAGNLNDAGAYHVGIVRWLAEYGTVHGLALIHSRLGFVSSWFAWSAALDHGELTARIGTIMNGLLFLLCLGQLLLVTRRAWRNQAEAPDFLALLAWLLLLPSFLRWDQRLSPSPDIAVLAFGIVVAWAILVVESQAMPEEAVSRARFMVLLLAAGAFLVKLSAAPLLAAGGLYFVWAQARGWLLRLGIAGATAAAFLGVLALAGLLSSGCAFFPWPHLCTDLPWSIGRDNAQLTADVIHTWAAGSFERPQLHGTALLVAWIQENYDLTRWIAFSLVAAIWLLLRRKQLRVPGVGWASIVAAFGVPFFLITAPAGRFGWSYLILLPLLAILTVRATLADMLFRRIANPVARRKLGIAVTAVGAIYVTAPLYKEFIDSKSRAKIYESLAHRKQGDPAVNAFNAEWWLIPNQYADLPGFTLARARDFDYSRPPATGLCWHHVLPCSYENLAHVRLRDAGLRLPAGFEREPGATR